MGLDGTKTLKIGTKLIINTLKPLINKGTNIRECQDYNPQTIKLAL